MSSASEINAIVKIAKNEFRGIATNRFMILVSIIIILFTVVDGARNSYHNDAFSFFGFVFVSMGSEFFVISLLCTIVAAFIGLTCIADDRNNSISVLLTKPLYRRDVILGKFAGLSFSQLSLIAISIFFSSVFLLLFYGMTDLMGEFILRQCTLIAVLFIECAMVSGVTMLFGLLFKNFIFAMGMAVTYFFIDWYANPALSIKELLYISPNQLYMKIFLGTGGIGLYDTSYPYMSWLGFALPYVLLMIFLTIALVSICCFVFTKRDQVV
jgi:ABC-2 type transport system permease protein